MYFVYIIYSPTLGKFYVGSTNDLENRFYRHNSKQEKFTRKGTPWKLVWNKQYESRKEAVILEVKIKKRGITRFMHDNQIAYPEWNLPDERGFWRQGSRFEYDFPTIAYQSSLERRRAFYSIIWLGSSPRQRHIASHLVWDPFVVVVL